MNDNLLSHFLQSPIVNNIYKQYTDKRDFWNSSDISLRYLMSMPPRSKGKYFEQIVQNLCSTIYNLEVKPPKNSNHDRIISSYTTEIKGSFTWDNKKSNWTWEQIRKNQDYERIIFLGINPNEMFMWWTTKEDLELWVFPSEFGKAQHGGKNGKETFWEKSKPEIPNYFRTFDTW